MVRGSYVQLHAIAHEVSFLYEYINELSLKAKVELVMVKGANTCIN